MTATTTTASTGTSADNVLNARGPGAYPGIPADTYHADTRSLSSTGAKRILDCPARFRWQQDHPTGYVAAFELGHAVHALILGAGADLHVVKADSWRSKAARAERAEALKAGSTPLLEAEYSQVLDMRDALAAHPIAGPLFAREDRVCETSLYWDDPDTGVACRARPDWWSADRRLIVDLKTTSRSAAPTEFGRTAAVLGYHLQAAWYLQGVQAIVGVEAAFVHVVQETAPPHLVSVVQLDAEALQVGAEQAHRARSLYARCQETGRWPGYPPTVHSVHLPGWYLAQHDMAEEAAEEGALS